MWRFALILLCCAATKVTSTQIIVECAETYEFPDISSHAPSMVADLKGKLVTNGEKTFLNISWAINIDASNKNLEGTRFEITGEAAQLCTYNPPFAEADLSELKQVWFHHLVKVSHGIYSIQVFNLPSPPVWDETLSKHFDISIPPKSKNSYRTKSTTVATVQTTTSPTPPDMIITKLGAAEVYGIFGILATLTLIVTSCCLFYERYGARIASLPKDPVPVLVVYPAKNSAFYQAVVALAEFLQQHVRCKVAIDMWQQEKIAELGPLRWLAEQADAAHCVLIVSPLANTPSSLPCRFSPNQSLPEASIPAAAHDLYLLSLNMVASQAKNANKLAKFWVVQLSEQKDKQAWELPPEIRACRSFCLMRDLKNLCKTIHSQSEKKMFFGSGRSYNKMSTVKLREAIERQRGRYPSISKERQPLTSIIV